MAAVPPEGLTPAKLRPRGASVLPSRTAEGTAGAEKACVLPAGVDLRFAKTWFHLSS